MIPRFLLAAPLAITLVAVGLPLVAAHDGDADCVLDLQATASQEEMRVVLHWELVEGATALHVHRALNGAEPIEIAILGGDATTFIDNEVPGGVIDYVIGIDGHPRDGCPTASLHMHGPPPPVLCVENLAAHALPDGSIRLTWTATPDAQLYEFMRAKADGEFSPLGQIPGHETEFTDGSALEPGATYRYILFANGLPRDGPACPEVSVTAVPFFGSGAWMLVPLVGAVAAYAALRRARR